MPPVNAGFEGPRTDHEEPKWVVVRRLFGDYTYDPVDRTSSRPFPASYDNPSLLETKKKKKIIASNDVERKRERGEEEEMERCDGKLRGERTNIRI